MNLIWYDAKADRIFQDSYLEALFLALAIPSSWWSENPHIDVIGVLI